MAKSNAYRLCFLNGTRITGQTLIRCHSDDAARDFASRVRLVSSIEIWNGNRRVCEILADDSDRVGRVDREDAPGEKTKTASQHVLESRLLLGERRWGNDQLIKESRAALEDSRRLLDRPFLLSPKRLAHEP